MKKLDDICFIVQARLNSQRVPQKMIKPFAGSSLFELIIDKLIWSDIIPKKNIYASVNEDELKAIANKYKVNIYERSHESANNDNSLQKIYEWHNKLPYKYCVLISGCNPLLSLRTIDSFVRNFVAQEEENLFAVFEKKQYYWNKEGALVTPWPKGQTIMNTKAVEPTYEAAHVLYASRMDLIKDNKFMGDFQAEGGIKLFQMDELEAFDIDEPWQFEVAEVLYEKFK
tara:strand:- start:1288 stop:1971 length:684 start_codon:yes stop_codon:yes gene_type:complete